jgi:hypothetical protein
MSRSFIRQDIQVRPSDVYDDTFAMVNAETNAVNIEDDLNYLRSQEKVITGMPNWFDPPADSFGLKAIHDKRFTLWNQKADAVTVGVADNFVLLTGATKPSGKIAIGSTVLGTITGALLGTIGQNDLVMFPDKSNVVEVREHSTKNPLYTIESVQGAEDQRQIFGLLQVGSAATEGNTFGDTASDDQAQISFVYFDAVTGDVTACPTAAIEGKVIEYSFRARTDFYSLPENAYDQQITFVDNFGISIVELQDAYKNGNGVITLTSGKNLDIDLASNANFTIVNGAGNVLSTDKNTSITNSGYSINLQNQKEMRLSELATNGTNFTGFKAPASLAADVMYTMPSADGSAGQVLSTNASGTLSWVNPDAATAKMVLIKTSVGDIAANTSINITDAVTFTVVNPDSLTMGAVDTAWVKNYDVFLNGELMLSDVAGADDVYYVDSTHIKFTMKIRKNDIITIIRRKAV